MGPGVKTRLPFLAVLIVSGAAPLAAQNAPATNAPPASVKPLPFLAPPPMTSQIPEAPEIGHLPSPTNSEPAQAAPPAPALAAPAASAAAETPPGDSNQLPLMVPRPPVFIDPAGRPEELAAHLLVVCNGNDPESRPLADDYAKRRAIPPERVLTLSCPTREEITRDEFDQTIREPILNDLFRHNWLARQPQTAALGDRSVTVLAATHNDIWAIVLMRGVPLKIADSPALDDGMEPQTLLRTNAAAVDSELALLPVFGLPLGGFVPNPFFDATNADAIHVGPELATKIILVTRMDGPSAADVRRMIDDCLLAEHERLAGQSVVDSRGLIDVKDGYTQGDIWMRKARDLLAVAGWPVLFDDRPETLPATEPLNDVAFYLGWYTATANGPWVTPPGRFVPGAIAYHLHSFSAVTVRSATENWVGPLIDHGADATMGNVYEPYLALTPHLDIFTKRLLDGDSFGEAAYASELGLSWMTTVVGDRFTALSANRWPRRSLRQPPGQHRDWLRLQDINRSLMTHPPSTAAALETDFAVDGAGPVLDEHAGDLFEKLSDPDAPAAAEKAYTLAMNQSAGAVDRIRIGLKLAQEYAAQNEDGRAQATLQALRSALPQDAARFGVTPAMVSAGASSTLLPAGKPFDSSAP